MSTLTIRIPEAKHAQLRLLAQNRGLSMNKLIDELATVALTQHDAETRFRALAARGSVKRGLELLDKLDRRFRRRKTGGLTNLSSTTKPVAHDGVKEPIWAADEHR